ncbi:hypothetical protein SAMN04488021_11869 [Paracoccus aminovorans]|uniref:Uncharacterized protein n=1 Tax=Paracoccus aminovorans TaxID=34004 RepID=A0A1I3B321_9RHOB|nr:hypothetical protein [Paracoccus aminovorans]CQR85266.1 hypothetical protein JCM7685_0685 [Paracoccus aminovorans]SFH56071.1 hypothetical protein SAMN04488021_11869 [Paracoccus aminovorans]
MAKRPTDPHLIRETIADLRQRLDALPSIDSRTGDLMDQHRRHRAAAEALADHLRTAYGARIAAKAWTNTIRMHGISSSGTSGLHQASRNWIAAAERKLAAIEGNAS